MRMTGKKYEEGRVIIEEGKKYDRNNDHVYWILAGQVEVWKGGNFITLLGEGEVFGELAAFSSSSNVREATVKSKTKLSTRRITGRALLEVINLYPNEAFMSKLD